MQLKAKVWGFDDFLRNGLVEYLDVNEEDNALIALYEENIGTPADKLLTYHKLRVSLRGIDQYHGIKAMGLSDGDNVFRCLQDGMRQRNFP